MLSTAPTMSSSTLRLVMALTGISTLCSTAMVFARASIFAALSWTR